MEPTTLNVSPKSLEEGLANEHVEQASCCGRVYRAVRPSKSEIQEVGSAINKWYYAHTTRTVRNLVRVSFAGGMSTIGGGISGDPRVKAFFHISAIAAVWFGSSIGGFGNAASTWLAWETDTEDRVAVLELKVDMLTNRLTMLEAENRELKITAINPEKQDLEMVKITSTPENQLLNLNSRGI